MNSSITIQDVTTMTDEQLKILCDNAGSDSYVMMCDPTGSIADVADATAFENINKKGFEGNQMWYRLLGYNLTGKVKINGTGWRKAIDVKKYGGLNKHYGKKADMQFKRIPFVEVSEAMYDDWSVACSDEAMKFDRRV